MIPIGSAGVELFDGVIREVTNAKIEDFALKVLERLKALDLATDSEEEKAEQEKIQKESEALRVANTDLARVNDQLNFKGRIEREEWVQQAAKLAREA